MSAKTSGRAAQRSSAELYDDAGEVIPGARKHEESATSPPRGLVGNSLWHDPYDPNELPAIDDWWPKPDWQALVSAGTEPAVAAQLYFLRKNIAAGPPLTCPWRSPKQWADWYLRATEQLPRLVAATRKFEDWKELDRQYDAAMGWPEGKMPPQDHPAFLAPYALGRWGGRSLKHPFDLTPVMQAKANGLHLMGWPEESFADPEGNLTILTQTDHSTGLITWSVIEVSSTSWNKLKGPFETLDEAAEWAQILSIDLHVKGKQKAKTKEPRRPELAGDIVRLGPNWRARTIESSEAFIAHFGFRGIQFGNWVRTGERQFLLDVAWDALHDLAEVVGVRPADLSLGGSLAIALGARGKGGAVAHYERGQRVFNLTRPSGAGALAHEWWHALDHFLGTKEVTSGRLETSTEHGVYLSAASGKLMRLQTGIWKRGVSRSPAAEAMRGCMHCLMEMTRHYYRAACDRQPYWSSPEELTARAFEAAVFDRIEELGRRSDYLVHGVEADRFSDATRYTFNPYPAGIEREIATETILNALPDLVSPLR